MHQRRGNVQDITSRNEAGLAKAQGTDGTPVTPSSFFPSSRFLPSPSFPVIAPLHVLESLLRCKELYRRQHSCLTTPKWPNSGPSDTRNTGQCIKATADSSSVGSKGSKTYRKITTNKCEVKHMAEDTNVMAPNPCYRQITPERNDRKKSVEKTKFTLQYKRYGT